MFTFNSFSYANHKIYKIWVLNIFSKVQVSRELSMFWDASQPANNLSKMADTLSYQSIRSANAAREAVKSLYLIEILITLCQYFVISFTSPNIIVTVGLLVSSQPHHCHWPCICLWLFGPKGLAVGIMVILSYNKKVLLMATV